MKRLLLMIAVMILLAGCSRSSSKDGPPQFFQTANGPVELQFPAGWYQNKKKNPFDLQCFSQQKRMTTGVYLYSKEDLAADLKPMKLLQQQVYDLKSKRQNFQVLEKAKTVRHQKKTLTSILCSGEKESSRYYYRFTLIQFTDHPKTLVMAIQVAIPSYWPKHRPILEAITKSARIKTEE